MISSKKLISFMLPGKNLTEISDETGINIEIIKLMIKNLLCQEYLKECTFEKCSNCPINSVCKQKPNINIYYLTKKAKELMKNENQKINRIEARR